MGSTVTLLIVFVRPESLNPGESPPPPHEANPNNGSALIIIAFFIIFTSNIAHNTHFLNNNAIFVSTIANYTSGGIDNISVL